MSENNAKFNAKRQRVRSESNLEKSQSFLVGALLAVAGLFSTQYLDT